MKKKRFEILIVLVILGTIPVFFGTRVMFHGLSQTIAGDERQILRPDARIEPFAVESMTLADNRIEFGKPFKEKGTWLEDFSISYRNKTGKNIVGFSIRLFFPETSRTGNVMMYTAVLGNISRVTGPPKNPIFVRPEEILTFKFNEAEFRKLETFLNQRENLELLNRVDLRVGLVLFDDGTAWDGQFRKPDPDTDL